MFFLPFDIIPSIPSFFNFVSWMAKIDGSYFSKSFANLFEVGV